MLRRRRRLLLLLWPRATAAVVVATTTGGGARAAGPVDEAEAQVPQRGVEVAAAPAHELGDALVKRGRLQRVLQGPALVLGFVLAGEQGRREISFLRR